MFEGIAIVLGLVLALWGLFHQLIAEAAVSRMRLGEPHQARIFVVAWVAQGACLSFCGLLPAVLLFFHGAAYQTVHTAMLLDGAVLILLSSHVFFTGFRSHITAVRLGAILQLVYGLYLIAFIVLSHPFL